MDLAFAPGTEPFLRAGKGGLRARILTRRPAHASATRS